MTAGMDSKADIWRMTNLADDEVGGAVVSGTVLYQNVLTRMNPQPREQLLLQQGFETVRTFTAIVVPGTLDIRERDEYEIVDPVDHVHYGDRFRITSVEDIFHNPRDPRNYMLLNLSRSVRAHDVQ